MPSLSTALTAGFGLLVSGAPAADRIQSLPGWDGDLPTAWYSGYLSFGRKHLHYVFTETESQDPEAPLLLWMNGGPGCSSMDGLFWEHGQLLISEDGQRLVRNPHAWTRLAHVLYLEAPVGVGYSFSEAPEDLQHLDDDVTAADNLAALKVFFAHYPEHKHRRFYVTGESYGGVYVPTLSFRIFQDNTVDWNMAGFAVGNGVMDWKLMAKSSVPFLFGHGAISAQLKAEIDHVCMDEFVNPTRDCQKLLDKVNQNAAGLNMYDYYRDCFASSAGSGKSGVSTATAFPAFPRPPLGFEVARRPALLREVVKGPRPPHPALGLGESVPCLDNVGGTAWLNRQDVRRALHINSSLPSWEICSSSIHYTTNQNYSAPQLYKQMMHKYSILVYNGDTDLACDYVADSWAMDSIQAPVDPAEDWVPWLLPAEGAEQTVGFLRRYLTVPGMQFLTVKGSGHMVPQWRPEAAYAMMDRFLHGKDMRTGAPRAAAATAVVV